MKVLRLLLLLLLSLLLLSSSSRNVYGDKSNLIEVQHRKLNAACILGAQSCQRDIFISAPHSQNFQIVQTGSRTHSAYYSIRNGQSSPMAIRLRRESDHSPPSIVEVRNKWRYVPS